MFNPYAAILNWNLDSGIGIEPTWNRNQRRNLCWNRNRNWNLTTVSGIGIGIGIECARIVPSLVKT